MAAGAGNISFGGAIGGTTPLNSLQITSAANVTAPAISAGTLTQIAGTGTTTFNGAIATTASGGISLTGTTFLLNGTTTTTNAGPFTMTNSGILTISPGANMALAGAFTQNGSGGVSLGANIVTANGSISVAAPLTLTHACILNSGAGIGSILLSSTVNGAFNLTLIAGAGNITCAASLGGSTRLGTLQISSANNVTLSSVTTGAISLLSCTDTASFNGPINTNTSSGISLTGNTIDLNGSITTTAAGGVTIDNSGTLTLGTATSSNVAGAFIQDGEGSSVLGGQITTSNNDITFTAPVSLDGLVTLNTGSGAGDILFSNTVDGSGGLDLTAGTGTVAFDASIGQTTPLSSLTIHSSSGLSLENIGTSSQGGVSGPVSLTSSGIIDFTGPIYDVGGSLSSTGSEIDFTIGVPIAIISGGSLTLAGSIDLSTGSDLNLNVSGNVALPPINGTTNENIAINAGGSVSLGNTGTIGSIDDIIISAGGSLTITGPIVSASVDVLAGAGITDPSSSPVTTTEDAIFNAPHGNVGSIADPIGVVAGGQVFTGTQFNGLAVFSGTTSDNTIHALVSDPPAILIFNGEYIINNFHIFPSTAPVVILPYVQGIYSQDFNLSSNFYLRSEEITSSAYSFSGFPLLSWTPCTFCEVEHCRKKFTPPQCKKLWKKPNCNKCNLKKKKVSST